MTRILSYGILLLCLSGVLDTQKIVNHRPIIGILAQQTKYEVQKQLGPSQIFASYVKYIEAAGGRAVPIKLEQEYSYYQNIVKKTNGLLFPGGNADFTDVDEGYGKAGEILFKLAHEINNNKTHFPVLGICLGFEMMVFLTANKDKFRDNCGKVKEKKCATNYPSTVKFTNTNGTLLEDLPKDLKTAMEKDPIIPYNHHLYYDPDKFRARIPESKFLIRATGRTRDGDEFVSIIEAPEGRPFYGVAFHPEKAIFEWNRIRNKDWIPHSRDAIDVAYHFTRFFVNEARRNDNKFDTIEEENKHLIYNCCPVYTSNIKHPDGQHFYMTQSYFITDQPGDKICKHECPTLRQRNRG